MEGGTGESTGDLSPSAGGLIPGGVTVLNNTRGVAAQTGWRASCSRDNSRWRSVKKTVLFIPGHRLFVYTRGCLFTPAALRWRALRWPVQSCRAVAATFMRLASGQRWLAVLLQGGLSNIQYRRWPGSTVEGSRLR